MLKYTTMKSDIKLTVVSKMLFIKSLLGELLCPVFNQVWEHIGCDIVYFPALLGHFIYIHTAMGE
jgi:hypothetical protein